MAQRKYVYLDFETLRPTACEIDGTAATGSDTVDTVFSFGDHQVLGYNQGNNTTNINFVPTVDGDCLNGLALPSTNADNLGMTLLFGSGEISNADHCGCFTVGTSPAFFCKCQIGIPDISDYDVFFFGFIEPATFVDNIESTANLVAAYDEKAGWGLGDNAGDIDIITSLAGADVATDTTTVDWTDDDVKTLQVNVSSAGAVTYRIWAAGTEDTSTGAVAFSFADTTVVQPALIFGKCANAADTPPIISYIEWGYQ